MEQSLEERVAALETALAQVLQSPASRDAAHDSLWAVTGIEQRAPSGGIVFAGVLDTPAGGTIKWQWGEPADVIVDDDWGSRADALSALGNVLRLNILQAVLHGTTRVAALVEELESGTSGQVYHHLKELTAAGWLTSPKRGEFAVPNSRLIPLLAVISAAGDHRA